jgi:hypothetical protein
LSRSELPTPCGSDFHSRCYWSSSPPQDPNCVLRKCFLARCHQSLHGGATDAANLISSWRYPCRLMLPPVITACQACYSSSEAQNHKITSPPSSPLNTALIAGHSNPQHTATANSENPARSGSHYHPTPNTAFPEAPSTCQNLIPTTPVDTDDPQLPTRQSSKLSNSPVAPSRVNSSSQLKLFIFQQTQEVSMTEPK